MTKLQMPLDDITVLDLTQVVAGPMATMMLGDFGATVIKVEPLDGEPYRKYGQVSSGENINFSRFNRGKKSVSLNLKTDTGKEALARLVKESDVLIENFRPGVLARLGFSWETLHDLNPRLIYATISGYGHDDLFPSPYMNKPAYALIAEAMGGITSMAGQADGPPVWLGFAMSDIFAGSLALSGVLIALREQARTNVGKRVDIALYDGAVLMNDLAMAVYSETGQALRRGSHGLQAPWGIFPAAGNQYLCMTVLSDEQWYALVNLIGDKTLLTDERYSSGARRSQHQIDLDEIIGAWMGQQSLDECLQALERAGIVSAPVASAADVFNSPQTSAREMLVRVSRVGRKDCRVVGNPIKISGVSSPCGKWIPELGQDNYLVEDQL